MSLEKPGKLREFFFSYFVAILCGHPVLLVPEALCFMSSVFVSSVRPSVVISDVIGVLEMVNRPIIRGFDSSTVRYRVRTIDRPSIRVRVRVRTTLSNFRTVVPSD